MYTSAENGFCAKASSRITLSRVRITVWSTDSGSSADDAAVWRSVTSTWPRPVVASAAIRGSSPWNRMSRPRSAPAWSTAIRSSVLIRLPRTHRLRSFDYRPDIQLFDGRAEGCGGRRRFQVQPRVTLVELPHFAERAPPKIAVPRVSQIGVGDGLKAARRVEARGQLMGQALVLDEAVLARRVDGLFVEALGVQFPLFQTRELGANQCRPVCERCRTVVCPDRYLLEMRC